jgi:hypothetical protein
VLALALYLAPFVTSAYHLTVHAKKDQTTTAKDQSEYRIYFSIIRDILASKQYQRGYYSVLLLNYFKKRFICLVAPRFEAQDKHAHVNEVEVIKT